MGAARLWGRWARTWPWAPRVGWAVLVCSGCALCEAGGERPLRRTRSSRARRRLSERGWPIGRTVTAVRVEANDAACARGLQATRALREGEGDRCVEITTHGCWWESGAGGAAVRAPSPDLAGGASAKHAHTAPRAAPHLRVDAQGQVRLCASSPTRLPPSSTFLRGYIPVQTFSCPPRFCGVISLYKRSPQHRPHLCRSTTSSPRSLRGHSIAVLWSPVLDSAADAHRTPRLWLSLLVPPLSTLRAWKPAFRRPSRPSATS